MKVTRRELGFGVGGLAVLAAGIAGYRQIFTRHYAPTPYDDLLHQIVDREPASRLGKALPKADVTALVAELRQPGFDLAPRARGDAAAGRVTQVKGWIVPQSVARYSQLASQF